MKLVLNGKSSVPIWFVTSHNWSTLQRDMTPEARQFAKANGFEPVAGRVLILPDQVKGLGGVLLGQGEPEKKSGDAFLVGKLVGALPKGLYHFANSPIGGERALELATLSWLLSSYKYARYKSSKSEFPLLVAPKGIHASGMESIARSVALVRDLVNTPANDLGPEDLERSALALCKSFKIKPQVIRGAQLLKQNFPLIHAVGRAAKQEPRLIFPQGQHARQKSHLWARAFVLIRVVLISSPPAPC
jgi:leucyl aminopeptidase